MVAASNGRSINIALKHGPTREPIARGALAALVVAAGYYAGVHAGMALTPPSSPVSTLWPPNAILLAGLLLVPFRCWGIILAAVLPAHFAAEVALGVPLPMAALWYLSNVSEALFGAAVILRILARQPHFERVRDVSVFLLVGVVLGPLVSSFVDAAFVALVGWRYGAYWEVWRARVFSNALATLILVPLIVSWFQIGLESLRRTTPAQFAELGLLLVGLCGTATAVFGEASSLWSFATYPYLPLPFLIWAAVRFGVLGVSLSGLILAAFAIAGVLRGRGFFASVDPKNAALTVQTFLVIAQFSLLLLAASLAELRRAKKVAARQEERLNLALDAAGIGTWEWDLPGERITWRSAQATLARANARSRSPARLLRLVHKGDRQLVQRAIHDTLDEGTVREIECRFVDHRGGHRWITIKGRIHGDAKGKPLRMIGVYVDTTERKDQELQARAQREQLAHLARVSTLGELSGAIAHELNQPLTAILLNAQAALRELGDSSAELSEIVDMLEDIVAQDKRAGAVIRRLRALLLKGALEMQPVNLNDCIQDVLKLESTDLVTHHVTTDLHLQAGLPHVNGDRVQLQQVLLNLVLNARDAMSQVNPGNRKLRIASAVAGGLAQVEVCDTGNGVRDPEAIFEPFFSTKGDGIGMGLTICRTIITAHGGRIWASNNSTAGATFHISMPIGGRRV